MGAAPTGNSLAQAQWASPHFGGQIVKAHALDAARDATEAKVFNAHWAGQFAELVGFCEALAEEEPFSSRPHQFGSAAAITIESYDKALYLANEGIKRRGGVDDPLLCNNKIYALIALEKYEEAVPILERCLTKFPYELIGPLRATAGMFAFRIGEAEEAVKRYREAISTLKKTENRASEAIALAYFAKEAARANISTATAIFKEASELSKNMQFVPQVKHVLNQAETWLAVNALGENPLPLPTRNSVS